MGAGQVHNTVHVSKLLPREEIEETEELLLPNDMSLPDNKEEATPEVVFKIHGTNAQQQMILAVLEEFKHVFKKTLSNAEAAKVTPMTMDVDYEAFKADKRSREPTRAQTAARKIAIQNWIRQSMADNIIRPSSAEAWSQLMLTKKPNGSWRFAIDYRALNKYTKSKRSQIPNIQRLLSTIGRQQPKFFAKMDLTQGFWQTPLSEEAMHFTAFATDLGLYEFTRASMGLLNSPWYFQSVLEREVFNHIIHKAMELYIDDILTWSKTIEELCNNLRLIFKALESKGMTLNPAKCEFGMSEVEFVGHLIDATGISFTSDKLKQIAKMPLPQTKGDLKVFLGMANYFRKHVPDFVDHTERLNAILEGYEKRHAKKVIDWQEDEIKIYHECQEAVINCRKLYYEVPGAPIRVYTDASEYGIGAYLCQVMEDGTEVPIDFISRSLTKAERRWSVYEKEAFAIFFALRKWEAHLLDVKFTLFTDHKNLTYISKDPNAKVTRWRLAVQDYDFDIAYIPGEDNFVADAFSRCCEKTTTEADKMIDTASVSIAALNVSLGMFDEWQPLPNRLIIEEKEHNSYFIDDSNKEQFYQLHNMVSCHAMSTTQVGYIPPSRMNIIEACHNHKVGHFGVNRTIELVNQYMEKNPQHQDDEWLCIRKDVETYITRCDCCIKMRERQLTSHVQKYTTADYGIMKCLSVDAIYMPKSKAGNKYILCVIDAFTRYTALYALKDLTALTAAKTMMNHFCVYGVPVKITTDNSTQFDAEFKDMLNILKTENYRTHPYSHQENGLVERANKEVIRHARNIAYELKNAEAWDEDLLKVQSIMNSKVSEATGLSPSQIVFAGQIDLYAGRLYPQPSKTNRVSMSKYMQKQLDYQEQLMTLAEEQQYKTTIAHFKNNEDNETKFQVGQYIVVRHENGIAPTKLSVRWHGPYRILEVNNRPQGTVYTCYSPKDGKIADYHASIVQWHSCQDDTMAVRSQVLDDNQSFIVEDVIKHDILKVNGTEKLNLLIKWFGYEKPSLTGMNISLKRNEVVQRYLIANNLEKYGIREIVDNNPEGSEPLKKRVRFSASTF